MTAKLPDHSRQDVRRPAFPNQRIHTSMDVKPKRDCKLPYRSHFPAGTVSVIETTRPPKQVVRRQRQSVQPMSLAEAVKASRRFEK